MNIMTISENLSNFGANLSFEAIPDATITRAKYLILDAVGIALASTRYDFAHRSLSGLSSMGAGSFDVIGFPNKLELRDAITMNAILVHGLDFDDTHIAGVVHPTASCLPCSMGIGSQIQANGKEVLAAYVLGMEAVTRLSAVAKGGFHQVGFHPTGLVGTFACALIAGRLYGMNAEQMNFAQGIALSMASGSLEFLQDGAWTKRMHPGWSGVSGFVAANMARAGFVGPKETYEGRYGLYNSYLGKEKANCDLEIATRDLGSVWEVAKVAVKPYPACHFTHACIDSSIALMRDHNIPLAEIKSIRALVPKETVGVVCEPLANKRRPANSYEAQFSIPYAIACGLKLQKFGLSELKDECLCNPEILGLAAKVCYEIDPKSGFPEYYSGEVVVSLQDGRELSHREHMNRGCQDRPLSSLDIEQKYMKNAEMAVSGSRAREIQAAVLNLDKAEDVRVVTKILSAR